MKSIIIILCCIASATALVIPSPEQVPLAQAQGQVVVETSPRAARPEAEALIVREESTSLEASSKSCFCTGGALCCEKGGETDCGFGVCGI